MLALAWALYLIPKAVKQHDEVGSRSVDRFSSAMRVLARNEPVDDRNTRVVATPPRSGERVVPSSRAASSPSEASAAESEGRSTPLARGSLAARRAAARAAARRRRRVTLALLLADIITVTLAALAFAPWWAVAVPAALTVLYLVLCRRQVRRENDALWGAQDRSGSPSMPRRRAVRVDAAYGSEQVRVETAGRDAGSAHGSTSIPVTDGEVVPVAVETTDGGSLWDPLPVTLPTYVNKARVSRTVRTIDLSAPGTWSSGHDESDTALLDESVAAEQAEPAVHEHKRAVGS